MQSLRIKNMLIHSNWAPDPSPSASPPLCQVWVKISPGSGERVGVRGVAIRPYYFENLSKFRGGEFIKG